MELGIPKSKPLTVVCLDLEYNSIFNISLGLYQKHPKDSTIKRRRFLNHWSTECFGVVVKVQALGEAFLQSAPFCEAANKGKVLYGLGLRVWGSGFRVWGLGFGVQRDADTRCVSHSYCFRSLLCQGLGFKFEGVGTSVFAGKHPWTHKP